MGSERDGYVQADCDNVSGSWEAVTCQQLQELVNSPWGAMFCDAVVTNFGDSCCGSGGGSSCVDNDQAVAQATGGQLNCQTFVDLNGCDYDDDIASICCATCSATSEPTEEGVVGTDEPTACEDNNSAVSALSQGTFTCDSLPANGCFTTQTASLCCATCSGVTAEPTASS